jgi:hypothetical protein
VSALGARTGVFNIRTPIAVKLEVFTHIAAGATTSNAIAPLCHGTEKASECFATILPSTDSHKDQRSLKLAPDTAALLDKNSPWYMGSVAEFFTHPMMVNKY